MSDLISIFNISKRGMNTHQKVIGVTSHNIANVNTKGYSRQRAEIQTTKPFGMPDMTSSISPGQLGTGSYVQSIQRVRDGFLDYQIRNESSTLGRYESREKYLNEIESIFNEPTEYGMSTMIGKFFEAWYGVSKQPEDSNARTVAAQQSDALAKELNHTYNQLKDLKANVRSEIKEKVFNINNVLAQLDDLNQQIMSVKISGMEPNDLMDRRDLLIDNLSKDFNINIDKKEFNSYNLSPGTLKGVPGNGEPLLVRKEPNFNVSRFSYVKGIESTQEASGEYSLKISYFKKGNANEEGKPIIIKGIKNKEELKEITRYIDECRVIWSDKDGKAYCEGKDIDLNAIRESGSINMDMFTERLGLFVPNSGELKGFMSVQKDVDKYMDQLNKLAKSIALSVNTIHSGKINPGSPKDKIVGTVDADYMPFFVNGEVARDKYDLENKLQGDNLKEVLDKEVEINAGNISLNKWILSDVMQIKTKTHDDEYAYSGDNKKDGESDGNRALAISRLQYTLIKIQGIKDTTTREEFIKSLTGTGENSKLIRSDLGLDVIENNINGMKIDAYFKDIVDELGIQTSEAHRIVINQKELLSGFSDARESVSGVSIDEEMANLVQFQHAYQASARMISVVDQLLDVVINGLIR